MLHLDQRRLIEQTKFTYSPLEKTFEKQSKTIEEQRKQIDTITNPNKGHTYIYKEIFDKLPQEKFHELTELTHKIHHSDLIYYFQNDDVKRFYGFDNDIELFRKMQSLKMKLEDPKELEKYI